LEEFHMSRCKVFKFVATIVLMISVSVVPLTAQVGSGTRRPHVRYKLIDMGTLGGPNSTDIASPIMNNQGTITGGADTADSDPNAPNCYSPDCFIMHAYIWRKGVLTDLGGLPGGFGSEGNWINDYSQVAGQSLNGSIDPLLGTPAAVAVLWKSNGQIVDLGTLGGNESLAATINNRAQVVGAAANTIPDPFPGPLGFWGTQTRAFLWEKGVMKDLGDLGGPDAFAISVNERGQIAGISYTSSTPSGVANEWCQDIPPQNPFLWEKGRMIDLGTLGGACGFPSFSSGLNNKGQVVGQSDLAGDFTAHPFLWDPKTNPHLRDLGTLGGTFGSATGLNDAGEIVGVATIQDDAAAHAFFWRNGVMQDLGTVKGDGCSVAYHINAKGQVVGTSGDFCNEVHAFLWQRGGPIMDLNDLVPSGSGLELTAGEFINDRGEIAASGVLPNGDHHAILLIPCDDKQTEHDDCGGSAQSGNGSPTRPAFLASESPDQLNQTPRERLAKVRARMSRRYHIFNTGASTNSAH
jgi:probable HAF family extracellular repeat protein